jgi:excisionase family DNA binding protein
MTHIRDDRAMSEPRELSPSQAAARLGASTRSVQRWIAEGRLPARRVGGRWRVAVDAIGAIGAFTPSHAPGAPTEGPPSIQTLLVANRGEIAARIRRTCDRLGIRTVVPGEDGRPDIDLLDARAVVAAALAAGADAVHPGIGFLSENADFGRRVSAAGLRWVGPPPAAIGALGDKATARRLAAGLGIPVISGYDGTDQSDAALAAAAEQIGLPLVVKPAAGGGGKGMQVVRNLADLHAALASSRREAASAFGDDRVILERYLEGPRHVEVQVLFDAHGAGVHLGERDCSVQRRHQKILEESPSPGVDTDLRGRLGEAALALGRAVGYVGAGTCEFLLDDGGDFFFLEMNTRLQVEHPVTETVTGRDLVADQLRIAAGEQLGFDQEAADAARRRGGHAVEVRLYAEDADAGFLPATGRVEALCWPSGHTVGPGTAPGSSGSGVRVDAGIELGTVVGDRFDPLLAKLVTGGRDRAEALANLALALDETVVLGLTTNLRFLRWLVRQPAVLDGAARVDTLERIWPTGLSGGGSEAAVPSPELWTVAATLLAATTEDGGWRMNAGPRIRLVSDDGTERSVEVERADTRSDTGSATEAGRGTLPAAILASDGTAHVDVGGRSVAFRLAPPPDVDRAVRAAVAHHVGGTGAVLAPMPGAVLAVHVEAGALVESGDPLVTLEAMKMEHVVTAPGPGTIAEIAVRPADQVTRGQLLVQLE